MRRNQIFIGLCFLAVVVALAWWLLRSPTPASPATDQPPALNASSSSPTASQQGSPPATIEERRREVVEKIEGIFATPITFYGKVVDQDGKPVPNARVGYSLVDKFNASGSTGHVFADGTGYFTIADVSGAAIGVNVSKEGYYQIHNVSNQSFAYGVGPDNYTKTPPTKRDPAVFVLQKMGETEPLVRVEKSTRIPKDGTPITVDLANGRLSSGGNFRVQAWTEAPGEGREFGWRCRVTVLGGGLAEREGQFDFEAPSDGYKESIEIAMPLEAEQWASQQQRDYFVKLADDRYARVSLRMIAGGNHYFVLKSFLNPKPGSRNLEFDPEKAVKSP